jgi:hypothetical protein
MHVVSANVIVADIATELDLNYIEAGQCLSCVLDDDADRDDNDDESWLVEA